MGPLFPKPQNLAKSATMQGAFKNLTSTFTQRDSDNSTGEGTNSYSIQIFSTSTSSPLFDYHHTAPNLASFNSSGVIKVDANTVYRVGSLTKVFMIYTFLVEAGDVHFNQPITNFIPELAAIAANKSGNAITRVAWEDITIGDLASHMAGITADGSVLGELTLTLGNRSTSLGFPPLPDSDTPVCGIYPLCNRTEFFSIFSGYYPAFAPVETPAYSNIAFQLLSYALENITGRNFSTSLQDKVLTPLNMNHTFYSTPDESLGVLPGNASSTEWNVDLGEESPAGSLFSTVADMSAFGRAILGSNQLTPVQTRRWLRPVSLTSDLRETVGYPWGLRRITLNPDTPYDIITSFNKAGTIGSYSSLSSLYPEYNIGFSVLVAGDLNLSNWDLADVMGNTILPALLQAAREEAQTLYGGDYSNTAVNSSLTLTTDSSKPGIGVSSWISNGTDMMTIANELLTGSVSSSFGIRLYPTELIAIAEDGSKQQSFKAIFEDLATQLKDNILTAACGTWIGPTAFVYGQQALDEFVFTTDPSGTVTSVEIMALRTPLHKTNS